VGVGFECQLLVVYSSQSSHGYARTQHSTATSNLVAARVAVASAEWYRTSTTAAVDLGRYRCTKFSTTSTAVQLYIDSTTVCSLKRPWSSPKKLFSMVPKVESRPGLVQDHGSGLRSDRGPVVLCDFSKLRF
jgi:hypothetical protein